MINEEIHRKLIELKRNGGEAVMVTVVEKLSKGPARVGAQMLVLPDGERIGTVGGGSLELAAVRKALEFMKTKSSGLVRYNLNAEGSAEGNEVRVPMVCGGKVTLFYQYISAGPPLFVFGAGSVGRPVARLAAECGFFVTIIDPVQSVAEKLSDIARIVISDYIRAFDKIEPPPGSYFFVSTLSHKSDFMVLKRIFQSNFSPKFVGMLASEHKTREVIRLLLSEVSAQSIDPDVFFSPVGLDIGGDTPEEIAISAVAQMQGIRYGRTGLPHKSIVKAVLPARD